MTYDCHIIFSTNNPECIKCAHQLECAEHLFENLNKILNETGGTNE